jgi:hypothetical protein
VGVPRGRREEQRRDDEAENRDTRSALIPAVTAVVYTLATQHGLQHCESTGFVRC